MPSKSSVLPATGFLVAVGYFLLWLLLWPTEQPYWMLPYGLRFGALLLAPMRMWPWLLGAEFAATGLLAATHGLPLGWTGFLLGEVPEPTVVRSASG